MKNKKSKVIFITGASSGIGREVAIKLAKDGNKVFAGVRRKIDKNEIESLNENITGVYIDVTNQSSIDKAFWFIIKHTDKIDVLINNAGIVVAGPIEFLSVKRLKEQFDVNTFGAVAVAQKFIPFLKNGLIINVSSMASTGIFPFISAYCASKRALDILFNSLLIENKDNIKVVSVKPAAICTPIWKKSVDKTKELFSELNEKDLIKYKKEMLYLEKNALENNMKGIDSSYVVNIVVKIINSKNPKLSYNVGFLSYLADFVSRLPLVFVNYLVKFKLNKINR